MRPTPQAARLAFALAATVTVAFPAPFAAGWACPSHVGNRTGAASDGPATSLARPSAPPPPTTAPAAAATKPATAASPPTPAAAAPPAPPTPTAAPGPLPWPPTPDAMAAWTRVAQCEEGGQWTQRGPVYSGALGISRTNWAAYAPAGWPADAADATPAQQVYVAQLIQHDAGLDGQVPDQDGVCRPW